VRGELQIIGSWNSSHGTGTISDWKACVDYLSREEIDVTPLITHTFPLKDIVNVFNMIQNKQLKSVKVLITPT
jgi:threonine dehydrogenase-like Zn-dependent dehydrogenase